MKRIIIILIVLVISTNLYAKKEWVSKHAIYGEYVESVQCIDDKNCLALIDSIRGRALVLYQSTDAGDTWDILYSRKLIASKFPWGARDMHYLDSNNIYASFSNGYVITRSTDGGKSFNYKFLRDSTWLFAHEHAYIENFRMYDNKKQLENL